MMNSREYNATPPVLQDEKDVTTACRLGSGLCAQYAVDGA